MERRVEEQTASGRTLLREYDAAGKLVRITILPLRKDVKKRSFFSRREAAADPAAAPTPDPAPPAPLPEPAADAAPAPALAAPPPMPVHVRFPHDAPRAGIDVIVERYEDPEPPRLRTAPRPTPRVETPVPTLLEYTDPEPVPPPAAAVAEPPPRAELEPDAGLADASPPEAPLRLARFEIVAIEEVAPPPRAPEPKPEPAAEPADEPAPVIAAPPEPAPPEAPERTETPALEPALAELETPRVEPAPIIEPAPEPAPTETAPEPAPAPRSYVALVPDVDQRVDALLARADAPAKRRKRAPIPAPAFQPLQREPWEERLDSALAAANGR